MQKMVSKLMPSEPKNGLLYVSQIRDELPEPSAPVTIIDSDGEEFHTKMHSAQARIDGLTKLHRKHNSTPGQMVMIEVDPNKKATVHVRFDDTPARSTDETSDSLPEESEQPSLFITASVEAMLEDFIANNLPALEPGLRLFKDEDGIFGRQYPTEVGTIDLLCLDTSDNLVVIELKKGRESDKVVGQISRYIGWVKAKLAKNSQQVRGIVVVHRPTDKYPKDTRLEYAIMANPQIALRYYEIGLTFFDHTTTFP